MTRRRFNRICVALVMATFVDGLLLMALLGAGLDPSGAAVMATLYALFMLGGVTLFVSLIGDRMVPRKDPESTQ